jgi:hypothetical protein
MMETSFVYCSVGLGIAILVFDAPVPIALMGRPSPRIRLNNCVAIDRCVTLPHRRKIALVERALARGFISLSRLAIGCRYWHCARSHPLGFVFHFKHTASSGEHLSCPFVLIAT